MAAQPKDPPSPPAGMDESAPVRAPVIQAPPTPALVPKEQVQQLLNTSDTTHRRPQPGTPFYLEKGAEGQDGPLGTSLGLLTDLAQIAEAAGNGWSDCPPLTEDGVSFLLDFILQQILSGEKPLTFIARLATDLRIWSEVPREREQDIESCDRVYSFFLRW